ncbi:MAG: ATP-binding protein [Gammaproteobacteria bacterium]|nr:ATP-binding protein [Gammaproteobacteria bacterium]
MDAFAGIETTELRPATKRRLARMARERQFKGVFHPGSSGWPPLLVGRERQAERINGLLEELLSAPAASRDIHAVTLHGPRGAGKTVLLDMVKRALGDNPQGVGVLGIAGTELTGMAAVAEAARALVPADGTTTTTKTGGVNLGLGKGGISSSESKPDGMAGAGGVANALRRFHEVRGERPLFVVDEAHAASSEALGALLNGLQMLNGEGSPCGAILAGTPDLIGVLRRAKATWYLDRSREARLVPVGSIGGADCALAIRAPLDAMGIKHDERALNEAARWCSGNPYFTQALGAAALEAAARCAGRKADFSAGGPVWEQFRSLAHGRYGEAWQNLDDLGLTGCARQLGALWRWAEGEQGLSLNSRMVQSAVNSGVRNPPVDVEPALSAQEARTHFQHLGLLWSPSALPEGPWELGLPSFFDFVEERYRDPRWNHYNKTLNALVEDESAFIPEDGLEASHAP